MEDARELDDYGHDLPNKGLSRNVISEQRSVEERDRQDLQCIGKRPVLLVCTVMHIS